MIKNQIKKIFYKFGLDLKFLQNIPFGIEWSQDIQFFTNDLKIVVDVGANIGQTAFKVLENFPNSRIYCFEPVPSTFEQLLVNTQEFSQIRQINAALGNKISKLPMTIKPLAQQNTLVLDVQELDCDNSKIAVVEVDTLECFCEENKIDRINLLKIDTEGYEMRVLQGAKQLLSSNRIDYILIECDFFQRTNSPHGNFVEIFNYLQPLGYKVVSFYTGGVDHLGWKWGDVLFRYINNDTPGNTACSPFASLKKRS